MSAGIPVREFMKKKWFRMAALVLFGLSLFTSGGGILAKTTVRTDVTSYFEVGIVDIELEEYAIGADGKETSYTDGQKITPGETVSKIPRVTNEGVDCYIRVKLGFETGSKTAQDMDEECLGGLDKNLKKTGEYWYYTKVLKHGESFDIFKEVTFPTVWNEKDEGIAPKVSIQVDAIQARNITPSFNTSNPWGSVEIESCLYEDGYEFNKFKKADEKELSVYLLENGRELVHTPDDFFTAFPCILPGDTLTDSVELRNRFSRPMVLYFASSTVESGGTLDEVELTITCRMPDGSSKKVYEGKLNTDLEYRLLGTFNAGQQGTLEFTLHVPEELGNRYALDSGRVKWLFMAEYEDEAPRTPNEPDEPDDPDAPSPYTPSEGVAGVQNIPSQGVAGVLRVPESHLRQTGDAGLAPYLAVFVISAAGFLAVLLSGRRKRGARSTTRLLNNRA